MSQVHTQLLTDDASGALLERSYRLRVVSGEEDSLLNPGDTARYPADRPHAIHAEGGAARAILIVQDS